MGLGTYECGEFVAFQQAEKNGNNPIYTGILPFVVAGPGKGSAPYVPTWGPGMQTGDAMVNKTLSAAGHSLKTEMVWYWDNYAFSNDSWKDPGWGFDVHTPPLYVLSEDTDNPLRRHLDTLLTIHECPPTNKSQAAIAVQLKPSPFQAPFNPELGDDDYAQPLMLNWAEALTRDIIGEKGSGTIARMYAHCTLGGPWATANAVSALDTWMSFYAKHFFRTLGERAATVVHECRHAQGVWCGGRWRSFPHTDGGGDPGWSSECGQAGAHHYSVRYLMEYAAFSQNGLATIFSRVMAYADALSRVSNFFPPGFTQQAAMNGLPTLAAFGAMFGSCYSGSWQNNW